MKWDRLRKHLEAKHHREPQKVARLTHGLALAKEGLDMLAAAGYRFWLCEADLHNVPDFPRLVFHVDKAPNGRVVHGDAELAELGIGWFDTLADAQHWDGVATQFEGRGGVKKPSQALTLGAPPSLEEIAAFAAECEALKQRRIAEFKAGLILA